jgi:hypothetical protein
MVVSPYPDEIRRFKRNDRRQFGRFQAPSNYSILNALTGSMDAARRAGMIPATNAANAMVTIAPVITLKSALVIS